jgi:AcrR family transcriptional regulator
MKRLPDDLAARLLAATDAMPAGAGFDVSIDELAKLSGVPRATLYYYFSGKDDVIQFYVNELLERVALGVREAASADGTVPQRLEGTLTALLYAFALYPKLCVELSGAVRGIDEHQSVMANMERAVLGPLRELLIEGRSSGTIVVRDIDLTAISLVGGLHLVAMMQIVTTGRLDADLVQRALVPQLLGGLLPR